MCVSKTIDHVKLDWHSLIYTLINLFIIYLLPVLINFAEAVILLMIHILGYVCVPNKLKNINVKVI